MTQEPPACHSKPPPCMPTVRTASVHGRYWTSAACCYTRSWRQIWFPSEKKTRWPQEDSIAAVSCPLHHGQEPWPDCLDTCTLMPASRTDYLDTHHLDLVSVWVTELKRFWFKSDSSFPLAKSHGYFFILLLRSCNFNCYRGGIFEPTPWTLDIT